MFIQTILYNFLDALYKLTRDIYIFIYEAKEVPDDYSKSIIVSLPKQRGANYCNQFRTINLLTHVSKISNRIIIED